MVAVSDVFAHSISTVVLRIPIVGFVLVGRRMASHDNLWSFLKEPLELWSDAVLVKIKLLGLPELGEDGIFRDEDVTVKIISVHKSITVMP